MQYLGWAACPGTRVPGVASRVAPKASPSPREQPPPNGSTTCSANTCVPGYSEAFLKNRPSADFAAVLLEPVCFFCRSYA
eukprot:920662-Rhodomonas_salina.1